MHGKAAHRVESLFGGTATGLVIFWSVARSLQVWLAGWGTGGDVSRYRLLGRLWGAGVTPYSGFLLEYPPGALPVFLGPLLLGGEASYPFYFGLEMMAFDLAALLLVVALARRLHPEKPAAEAVAGASYILFTAALFPVLYARFDLAPATLTLLALYLVYGDAAWAGAIVLGLAGAVKLWPLAVVPLFLVLGERREGFRGAARVAGLIAVGFFVPVLPVLARAGSRIVDFVSFHYQRGIQLESTWATLAIILSDLGMAPIQVDPRFGAVHLQGPAASAFARVSNPILVALALAPQVVAYRRGLGRSGDLRGETGLLAAGCAVLGFLVGGKVLSPQFMIWLMPFMALFTVGTTGWVATLAISVLTSAIYPYWWPALLHQDPGHLAALAAILTRNGLLLGFYVLFLRRLARPGAPPASSD
jgi:Glycosyltransferase family 87